MSIILNNISVRYGDKTVFDDFSFEFKAGHRYLLSAPSGRGKTTLCNIVTGLLQPSSGSIVNPHDRFGMVFQEDRLIGSCSATDNVRIVNPQVPLGIIRENLTSILHGVDLDCPVSTYSGGMRRRVEIVRALIGDASVIVADEPLSGLDTAACRETFEYIIRKSEGRTLIVSSHNPIWLEYCESVPLTLDSVTTPTH